VFDLRPRSPSSPDDGADESRVTNPANTAASPTPNSSESAKPVPKPKGIVHTTGGYFLGAPLTVKEVFDLHPDDRFDTLVLANRPNTH
jgi:hypothetical protein